MPTPFRRGVRLYLAVLLLMLYPVGLLRGSDRRCGTTFGIARAGEHAADRAPGAAAHHGDGQSDPKRVRPPLISRGGSSMLFAMIAFGMILSVSRQNDEQSHDRPKSKTL